MSNAIKPLICLTALTGALAWWSVNPVLAQTPATGGSAPVTDKAQKTRGGGDDAEIKSRGVKNNASSEAPPQPEAKGGPKARAAICYLHVDNQTRWYVEIYVDGYNRGTVAPYGDSYGTFAGGPTRFYAVAPFDSGEAYTWGPRVVNCNGTYTWQLGN